MRVISLVVLSCCLALPAIASAQTSSSNPSRALSQWFVDDLSGIDAEAHTATSFYLGGAVVLVLGAGTSLGLGLASVEAGLSGLFVPGASRGDSDALQGGAIAAAVLGGVIGLVLFGFGLRFDLDSGERRERWRHTHDPPSSFR